MMILFLIQGMLPTLRRGTVAAMAAAVAAAAVMVGSAAQWEEGLLSVTVVSFADDWFSRNCTFTSFRTGPVFDLIHFFKKTIKTC